MTLPFPTFESLPLNRELIADLRSDHAGETGAVAIYCGILAVTRDPDVRHFARHHLRTEVRHRRFFDAWLPDNEKSRLLKVWFAAGWLLGATGALFGRRSVYTTIAAVETFVVEHYSQQVRALEDDKRFDALRERLEAFRADDADHRDDASHRQAESAGWFTRAWHGVVGSASAAGVALARRF